MARAVIFLVRHGETEWNRVRRYQGWGDSPLTARGVAQAEAIGGAYVPCAKWKQPKSSPARSVGRGAPLRLSVARSLLKVSAAPPSLRFDERLREISIGAWDGLDRDEIAVLAPGIFDGDGRHEWYFRTPDGETYDDFAARIAAWLAEQDGRAVIAVTHGIVTRVMRGLYAGCHARPR